MKVLAVQTFQRMVVVEVLDEEDEDTQKQQAQDLAAEKADGEQPEWVYTDFYKEVESGDYWGIECEGVRFKDHEWFDI